MKKICPIIKQAVGELDCGDMILLSLDMSPERFVLEELRAVPNFKAICQHCDNNPYKEELAEILDWVTQSLSPNTKTCRPTPKLLRRGLNMYESLNDVQRNLYEVQGELAILKIYLELEVNGSLAKEISNISEVIRKTLNYLELHQNGD